MRIVGFNHVTSFDSATARHLLEAELEGVTARVAALEEEYASIVAAAESANLDDEHDPEGATIGFERAQIHALLQRARDHLADLVGARARLDAGTYGVCEACGGPIDADRLVARPTTATCIACASRSRAV